MKKLLLLIPALALLPALALASPVAQVVRVTDSSGNPVTGATFTIGGAALVAGTAATVTGINIDTGAALTSPSVKYYDFGDGSGQYSFIYDAAVAQGHFNVTASKSGVTLSNPVFGVNFYSDPSVILATNANTVALGTGQTSLQTATTGLASTQAAIKAKTDTITAFPADYQQRGVAVTLPTTAPAGYGGSGGSGPTAADFVTALKAAPYLTLPGTATTTGVGETLTYAQWQALLDAVPGGGFTATAPVKGGTASTTYYLRGAAKTAANIVSVSTTAYDAAGNITGRTVLTQQPFPSIP